MFQVRAEAELDVVGLGQCSMDHVCRVRDYPAAGAKTEVQRYQLLPGGQVATAALTARRLGWRACYVGAVGDDPLGAQVCRVLEREGVELRLRTVAGARTQFSVNVVDASGERTIFERYDPRAVVRGEHLDRQLLQSTRVLHLDITDVPAAVQAARWARDAGALVSLDIDRLLPGAEELMGLVDLLVASEGVPAMLGCPDPGRALQTLRRRCPGLVCVTLGQRGCLSLEQEQRWTPAFDVQVQDTTGCGDVFRGALIHGVLEGWDVPRALRFAAAAAALNARAPGAQTGVPTRAEVLSFLESEPPVLDRRGRRQGERDLP